MVYEFNKILASTIILVFVTFIISSCREKYDIVEPDPNNHDSLSTLIKGRHQRLIDNSFRMEMDQIGNIYQPYRSYNNFGWPGLVFGSGIWIGGYQNGQLRASLVGIGENVKSNFISLQDTYEGEVYYIIPEMLQNPLNAWPQSVPRDSLGNPKIFGDEMCWTYLKANQDINYPPQDAPFENIFVSQSMFSYDEGFATDAVFITYDISNKSQYSYEDVFLGYYFDIDMFFTPNGDCIGYDSTWQISYTYSKVPAQGIDKFYGIGCIMLKSPIEEGTNLSLFSHRYIERDSENEFSEQSLTVNSVYYALKGLDNNGNMMINPSTGTETKFAFTGNPVSQEGWVDRERDSRSLISVGPFNIQPNETVSATFVLYAVDAASFESLIRLLILNGSEIILSPQYWDF